MELKKLDPLTSLRFFAASLIVLHHSVEIFSFKKTFLAYDQGVSFFFVLSGFILTYVYPSLNSKHAIKRFFLARFARIWPVHFFCFLLVIFTLPKIMWIISPTEHLWPRALTNLLLIQAWIPRYDYFFSFDAPSWSISTEFFFYLCFPFLITRFRNTWLKKLTFCLFLVLAMILLSKLFHLADILHTSAIYKISTDGLIYINPISRLFEFALGMCTALLYMNLKQRYHQLPTFYYTAVEIALLLCVYGSLYFTYILVAHPILYKIFGMGGIKWFCESAIAPFAAALILVTAIGKGKISKILTTKIFVRLGEISFALYLVHMIVLDWFLAIKPKLNFSPHISYCIYWLVILACSYLINKFIEEPARKFILQQRYKTYKTLFIAGNSRS